MEPAGTAPAPHAAPAGRRSRWLGRRPGRFVAAALGRPLGLGTEAPLGDDFPVAQPKSLLSGKPMAIEWSANWDDDLGGAPEHGPRDPIVERLRHESEDAVRLSDEQAFMFFLPRICEHCLNPACAASCPSGAIYKRSEDGIVLVDHARDCRACCAARSAFSFRRKVGCVCW